MKKIFIFPFILIFLIIGFIYNLEAFCIHNLSDIPMNVIESQGGKGLKSFSQIINPKDKKCCNWKNKGCNKSGKRDGIVRFVIYTVQGYLPTQMGGNVAVGSIVCDIEIPAGGDVFIVGKNGQYRCKDKRY